MSHLVGIFIFLVGIISCLNAVAADDWDQLYQRLYQTDGNQLDPSETLEILNNLNKIPAEQSGATDVNKKNVEILLDISQYSEPKCTRSYFHSINTLIARNESHRQTIAPYLRHHRRELFRFCQPNYETKANTDLAKLDETTLEAVKQLRQSVIQSNNGRVEKLYDDYPQDAIVAGILSYLKAQAAQDFVSESGVAKTTIDKQSFALVANTNLREYCNKYTAVYQPKISPGDYKIFNDDELLKSIATREMDNLVELRICLQIKPRFDQLTDSAYNLFREARR